MAKRSPLSVGDYFEIPLGDASTPEAASRAGLGQILSIEPDAMGGIGCAFWPELVVDVEHELTTPPVIVSLVTPDLLKSRRWRVLGNRPVAVPIAARRYEAFRKNRWIGAKIVGAGIIREVLRAFHGLEFWDSYHDPNYITKLLQPGIEVPRGALFKNGT